MWDVLEPVEKFQMCLCDFGWHLFIARVEEQHIVHSVAFLQQVLLNINK